MSSRTTALATATLAVLAALNGLVTGRAKSASKFDDLGEPSRFASTRHRYR